MKPATRSYLPATAAFSSGSDDPRKFLERSLEMLALFEPEMKAFVTLDVESARRNADAAARRWREGKPLSRIDGMPVGIKDIIETAGMPTQNGSPLFAGWRTNRDAASVAALREAGALILGKTVTTEFAATEPRETRNPWDLRRTPGGSSSGSAAAVAAGIVPAALGTQVIGSILRPASYCGCVGYKPSVGGINRGGSYDNLSQSCTGVLAASLDEAWVVAREISARAGGDPGFSGLGGPMAVPKPRAPRALAFVETAGWAIATEEAKERFASAVAGLRSAGITIVDRAADGALDAIDDALAGAVSLSRRINAWESRWPLNTYARDMNRDGLSQAMQNRLAEAERMSLEEYRDLIAERERIRQLYATLAVEYDAAITLCAPGAAPLGLRSTGDPIFAVPSSLLGVPALTLPVLRTEGLPLGLQVIGFNGRDAELFSVAASLQDALQTVTVGA
jgi:Asp-tRNA(Asn)/Glu-tRNA(Gln) amidotransferase A subunit family amidase